MTKSESTVAGTTMNASQCPNSYHNTPTIPSKYTSSTLESTFIPRQFSFTRSETLTKRAKHTTSEPLDSCFSALDNILSDVKSLPTITSVLAIHQKSSNLKYCLPVFR